MTFTPPADGERLAPTQGRRAPSGRFEVRSRRAFTLIEVLLAVTVFAIVLTAIHTIFFAAVRLRNKTAETLDRAVPLQQALTFLRRDLANVVIPGGTLFGELQTTPTLSSESGQASLGSLTPLTRGNARVCSPDFRTATGRLTDTEPWAEVQRVSYLLAESTNQTAGQDLYRSVTRNLLPVLQDEPEDQWLMSGVEDLVFSYYDGLQWRTTWDSTAELTPLPLAIRVELHLVTDNHSATRPAPITLVVPITVQAAAATTSTNAEDSL